MTEKSDIKTAPMGGDPLGQRGYMNYRLRFRGPAEEAARLFPHRVRRVGDGLYAVIESDMEATDSTTMGTEDAE